MSNPDKTSPHSVNESLSALVDGEASELELRRILKSSDESMCDRWMRYNLIGDAMKNDVNLHQHMDFSASISAAIAEEPAYSEAPSKKKSKSTSFWPNLGRFAVAASVAGAVVVGVQFSPSNTGPSLAKQSPVISRPADVQTQPLLGEGTSLRVVGNQATTPQQPTIINQSTQKQIDQMEGVVSRLMLEHAQNASQNTQQGVLPYVRVPEVQQ